MRRFLRHCWWTIAPPLEVRVYRRMHARFGTLSHFMAIAARQLSAAAADFLKSRGELP